MSANVNEPDPYELTENGWVAAGAPVAGPVTLTAGEAAEVAQVTQRQISQLARRGTLEAVKVDGQWLVDGASLAAYRSQRPYTPCPGGPKQRRLPAAPLIRQVELAGGVAAVGSGRADADRALLERAVREGSLTLWAADHLAVTLLGLTLWDLWPDEL